MPEMPAMPESPEPEWSVACRQAAGRLAAARGRPCLLFHVSAIRRATVLAVREAVAGTGDDAVDVVVSSPGGDIDAAYVIARELRRRFAHVAAHVPLMAKSAATLLCLAADELVLGDLGELGPLDAQYDERRKADFPVTLSRLAPFTALSQLQDGVLAFYDDAVERILHRSGMRPFEACSKAAELTSAVYNAIYAQMDPSRLAESARGLELGCEYGSRVLRRYRPELHARHGDKLVHRLVHAYPSHGFVLDREELAELGLPTRAAAQGEEHEALEALAVAIIAAPDDGTLVELVPALGGDAPGGADRSGPGRVSHGRHGATGRRGAAPAPESGANVGESSGGARPDGQCGRSARTSAPGHERRAGPGAPFARRGRVAAGGWGRP
jgi:hypothetical protein